MISAFSLSLFCVEWLIRVELSIYYQHRCLGFTVERKCRSGKQTERHEPLESHTRSMFPIFPLLPLQQQHVQASTHSFLLSPLSSSPPFGTFPHPPPSFQTLFWFMINLLFGFKYLFPPTQPSPTSFSPLFIIIHPCHFISVCWNDKQY